MKREIKDAATQTVTMAITSILLGLIRKGIGALVGKSKGPNV